MPPQIKLGYLRVTYHCVYRGIIPVPSQFDVFTTQSVARKAIKKEKKKVKAETAEEISD